MTTPKVDMPFRYGGVDFVVTYIVLPNGSGDLWGIRANDSTYDLIDVVSDYVMNEAENMIGRHIADNQKP